MFKAGFVSIIGLPNVGKSSLLNALLKDKLSIVTHKAQTTRHRILGILNEADYQIVFSDTPGFVRKAVYKMQEKMNEFVNSSLQDADCFLFVTDGRYAFEEEEMLLQKLQNSKTIIKLIINKTDILDEKRVEEVTQHWKNFFKNPFEVHQVSALTGKGIDELVAAVVESLPEHPAYFDEDYLSDRNTRFFVTEIIREQIFHQFSQEIPYSSDVQIEEYKEKENITYIRAIIFIERETQKAILLGKNGSAIKKLGAQARQNIEKFIDAKVFLDLQVKVKADWRNNDTLLKNLGFN